MIVEEGTGKLDSNSYVDIEYADDYCSARGYTKWNGISDDDKEVLLIKATDYIDSAFKWRGKKEKPEQALNFPRVNCVDDDGFEMLGVPCCLKKAVVECALLLNDGTTLFQIAESNGAVTSEKIGDLQFSYDTAQKVENKTLYDSINLRLRGLYIETKKGQILSAPVERY